MTPLTDAEITALVGRVGDVAADYSNLTEDEAVRFIMGINNIGEMAARFRYGMATGTISPTGDVVEVKKSK